MPPGGSYITKTQFEVDSELSVAEPTSTGCQTLISPAFALCIARHCNWIYSTLTLMLTIWTRHPRIVIALTANVALAEVPPISRHMNSASNTSAMLSKEIVFQLAVFWLSKLAHDELSLCSIANIVYRCLWLKEGGWLLYKQRVLHTVIYSQKRIFNYTISTEMARFGGVGPLRCLNEVFRPHVEDSSPDPLLLVGVPLTII